MVKELHLPRIARIGINEVTCCTGRMFWLISCESPAAQDGRFGLSAVSRLLHRTVVFGSSAVSRPLHRTVVFLAHLLCGTVVSLGCNLYGKAAENAHYL